MSSRTVSIRLSSELIELIDEKCVTDGYCRNDFIKNAINEALNPKYKPIPTMKVKRVSYDDGKTWIDVD